MSGSPIVLAVCSSWNMRSQVVHLALSMSKAVCQVVLSRLNTFYTRSTSPLPMASSHSGPHVYPALLQHHSIIVAGECSS